MEHRITKTESQSSFKEALQVTSSRQAGTFTPAMTTCTVVFSDKLKNVSFPRFHTYCTVQVSHMVGIDTTPEDSQQRDGKQG